MPPFIVKEQYDWHCLIESIAQLWGLARGSQLKVFNDYTAEVCTKNYDSDKKFIDISFTHALNYCRVTLLTPRLKHPINAREKFLQRLATQIVASPDDSDSSRDLP